LPQEVRLFSIYGALLLPGGKLPLNVFEPKYLSLVMDAMESDRLLGIIQPKSCPKDQSHGAPYPMGCLGRIQSFSETDDGRFLISVQGLCRFRLTGCELTEHGYDLATGVEWQDFCHDLDSDEVYLSNRRELLEVMCKYLKVSNMSFDYELLCQSNDNDLINVIAMVCPFEPSERQALLEAKTVQDRADTLLSLMAITVENRCTGSCNETN